MIGTRFSKFTDAELKVLDNALSFAYMENEIAKEDCEDVRNELAAELLARESP